MISETYGKDVNGTQESVQDASAYDFTQHRDELNAFIANTRRRLQELSDAMTQQASVRRIASEHDMEIPYQNSFAGVQDHSWQTNDGDFEFEEPHDVDPLQALDAIKRRLAQQIEGA